MAKKSKCCVPGCDKLEPKTHRFPIYYEEVYNIWLKRISFIKLFELDPVKVNKNFAICDKHFCEECKIPGSKKLKLYSLPTLHLPGSAVAEDYLAKFAFPSTSQACSSTKHCTSDLLETTPVQQIRCSTDPLQGCAPDVIEEIHNKMDRIKDEPNCIKIRNDLCTSNKISKKMEKSEQVQIKIEETIAEINVKEEISEEFSLKKNVMPICLQKNTSENIGKVSIRSWNDIEKLEPGTTKNHESMYKEPNYNINIKREKCETDDILLKDYPTEETSKDNDVYEQFLTKYVDTVDKFCIKKEITEELIIKSEQFIIEDDEKVNMQGDTSYNNDVQLLSEDENNPGHSSLTKKDLRSTINAQNQIKYLLENSQMNIDEQFICSKCFKTFNSENELKIHNHSQICQKKLEYSRISVRHDSNHDDKKYHKCDVCKRTFTLKCSLKRHKLIHSGAKPYTCDVCKKSFMRKSHLNEHALIHTGERPYSCNVCEKRFVQKNVLIVHKRSHTGGKPYACDVCSKKFNTKVQVIIHTRNHTGEKPYTCDVCNETFKTKSGLIVHTRRHTGEKPYTCDVCNRKFSQVPNLIIHKRNHTDKKHLYVM